MPLLASSEAKQVTSRLMAFNTRRARRILIYRLSPAWFSKIPSASHITVYRLFAADAPPRRQDKYLRLPRTPRYHDSASRKKTPAPLDIGP